MREMKSSLPYLSPSSFKMAEQKPDEFYIEYLSGMPRSARVSSLPMSLGSAVDARIKEKLYKEFVSEQKNEYSFDYMFERIDSPDKEVTRKDSLYLFEKYIKCGAFADLVIELNQGLKGSLNFQFKLTTEIKDIEIGDSDGEPLRLSGWPDLMFSILINGSIFRVIYDWKVNGYYSAYSTSPIMYYNKCRYVDGSKLPESHKGFKRSSSIDSLLLHDGPVPDADWRDQLTIYSWMSGNGIEEECVHGIEQITGSGSKLRMTSARYYDNDKNYKVNLLSRLRTVWKNCNDGHFFKNLSKEDNDRKCELLDMRARLPDKGMNWEEKMNTEELMRKLDV